MVRLDRAQRRHLTRRPDHRRLGTLVRLDGVRLSGHFADGTVLQTNDGPGCTNEAHAVQGNLTGVSRSDITAFGSGTLEATIVHHRALIFGRCISYSASISGTMHLSF